ncbi:MAG: hypothetical protein KF729_13220 [Sandaracinaceae bacterium]|nr:hypothetical protein [Sandaracinaceae bacterium]
MSEARADSLRTLERLARDAATGELVCAAPGAEVHVHLQSGRVAWATSSAARFAFGKYVLERCDLDAHALRELVNECRRDGKPLGETLIAWGVATPDAIRAALREQILDALDTLRSAGPAQTVFLQRGAGYRSYNPAFTFALEELVERRRRPRASEPRLPRAPSRPPPPGGLAARLVELAAEEPEIRWIEHHRDGALMCRVPDGAPFGDLATPARALFAEDVEYAVVRGPAQTLIGVATPDGGGSVFCGVDPEVVLGAMVTVLRERLVPERAPRARSGGAPTGAVHVAADRGIARVVLDEVLERTPAVWGVALVDREGRARWLARRDAVAGPALEARVTPFSSFLRAARALTVGAGADVALPRASMAAASSSGWLFGGELLDETGRDLWLLVDPTTGQGLGWAILEALLRRTSLTAEELRR